MIRVITHNFGLKLFSVAAAFALWLAYSGARELTMSISVPVQYRNIPKDIEISSGIVEQVHLILRGPAPQLSRLTAAHIPVVLDLAGLRSSGQTTFTLDRRNVSLPAGIVLERANPGQIQVRSEMRITRQLPVVVRFSDLPAGMHVASCQILPPALTLAGPRSRVNALERVETDPVDLSSLQPGAEIRTTAVSGDPQVYFTTAPSITLRITLEHDAAPAGRK